MSLTHHSLYRGELLSISHVRCRPHDHACSATKRAAVNTLAFPLRGLFVKHHEGEPEVIASAGQALFFNKDEGYRVSHPAGGDDCLALEPSAPALRELLQCCDAPAAEREQQPFAATHASLPARANLERGLLLHGLREGSADDLETETRALELFAVVLRAARPQAPSAVDRRPRAAWRRREQAQAVAVALTTRPEEHWTLARLARQVHASPFHLARSFRTALGEPIHQYLLRARLARALEAVLDSGEDLTGIALGLGFATPSHFSAAFRKAYGVSASALRRRTGTAARDLRKISKAVRSPAN